MIIIIIAIFTLLTFFSFMFIKNSTPRWIAGGISFICLALTVALLAFHITEHWGMKEVTQTRTQEIYSAGPSAMSFGLLITQKMGDQTILVYKTSTDAKTTAMSAQLNTDSTSTTFLKDNAALKNTKSSYKMVDGGSAQLVTSTTKRKFSSSFTKLLFGFGGEQNESVKTSKTAVLPKDSWLVLTADQAKTLEAKQAELESQAAQAQKQLQAALAAAPTAEVRAAIEAQAKAKMSPAAQIAQIKQLLGISE